MYQVSEEYKNAIHKRRRNDRVEGSLTFKDGTTSPLSDKNIKQGSVSINSQCVNKQEFELGAAYAAELAITINTDADRYSLYDAVIRLSFFIEISKDVFEEIPFGVYTVYEALRNYDSVSLKALDNMLLLDKELGNPNLTGMPYEIMELIRDSAGIKLGVTKEQISGYPNGRELISVPGTFTIATWRDLVSYLAAAIGCFAVFNRTGALDFVRFGKLPVTEIDADFRMPGEFADFRVNYTSIETVSAEKTLISALDKDDGLRLTLENNPFFQLGLEQTRQRMLDNLLNEVKNVIYIPFSVPVFGDPAIDLGDMIRFTGGSAGEGINGIVTSYDFAYRGKQSLKGVGKNLKLAKAKTSAEKTLNDVSNKVDSSDIVYYSYINTKAYSISAVRAEIIFLNYTSSKSGTAEFKASIIMTATGTDTPVTVIKVIYRINDAEIVTYYPTETYSDGVHTMLLYYPVTFDKDKINRLSVYMEAIGGKASIKRMNVIASISGQGLVSTGGGFNGIINIDEFVKEQEVKGLGIEAAVDSVSCGKQIPHGGEIRETAKQITIAALTIEGFMNSVNTVEELE